jgi:hypothetical protein
MRFCYSIDWLSKKSVGRRTEMEVVSAEAGEAGGGGLGSCAVEREAASA